MPTPGVDFFRIDRAGATTRLLVIAGVMVACGATAVGAHLVHRLPVDVSHLVSLCGGVTVIAGLVLGFGTMAMMLFENVYLAIRDDDLLLHENGRETSVAWDDLVRVDVDARTGVLTLARREGGPIRWYAGKSAKDIASKVEEARRKAAHGLLKSSSGGS
ncbi:MAG: hypothetical protein KF819_18720 [Labilithrix sp.]|nr:hypothetical protein [Labilithrix sp.]